MRIMCPRSLSLLTHILSFPRVHLAPPPHPESTQLLDVDIVFDNSDVFPRGFVQLFSELEAQLWSEQTRPVGLCCGSAHVAVLTESGLVYTWGWGDRGQCGHGGFTGERRPRVVDVRTPCSSRDAVLVLLALRVHALLLLGLGCVV
jgi:hypothetical protein